MINLILCVDLILISDPFLDVLNYLSISFLLELPYCLPAILILIWEMVLNVAVSIWFISDPGLQDILQIGGFKVEKLDLLLLLLLLLRLLSLETKTSI